MQKTYKSGGGEDKNLVRANFESSAVWGGRCIGDRSDDFVREGQLQQSFVEQIP